MILNASPQKNPQKESEMEFGAVGRVQIQIFRHNKIPLQLPIIIEE
jgi:hypothetical protein